MTRQSAIRVFAPVIFFAACQARAIQQQPSNASSISQQVELLVRQGHTDQAKSALVDDLKQNPASVEDYNLLGIVDGTESDDQGALAAFQKALQLDPRSTRTHNNLGNVYVAGKKFDLAEKEFRAALRIDPSNQDGNYNLGVLLLSRGASGEAIPHFLRIHPSNVPTSLNLIRAYFQSKRSAEALRTAAALSAEHTSDVAVHFSLGSLLATEAQYKPAQLELEQADALAPATFEIPFALGQDLLHAGDAAKAELTLNRALKLRPESAETLYLLAQSDMNQSRPLDALDFLVRAHKLAPQNPDILYLMAEVSMSQNYFEDAIPLLESGIQIAPLRADFRAALGESYFMSGKIDNAIDEFKKLLELENSARSYAYLGLSYRNLGRFDEAKEYFQKGLKLDPSNSPCLFNLGYIAERQGDASNAEILFQKTLKSNPNFPDALLELANLRIASGKFQEAEDLLRKYVQVSRDPATGYYKLAKVERSLHQEDAANRDLSTFQTLSKDVSSGPLPYEHLFDYLNIRSQLEPAARNQLDLSQLSEEIKKHPEQPEDLYMLAEAYLKSGNADQARASIDQLEKLSSGDFRTLTGSGVLFARYHLYDDAIQHFLAALALNPGSDEVKFDLANAYFRKRRYSEALDAADQVSAEGRKDDAYLALLGDIYSHLGNTARAKEIFRDAIHRNPDDDQSYLALALLQFRDNDIAAAKETLLQGQTRIPGSGKILWGLGLASALEGKTAQAADQLERAVDLLPEWPGSYSTLGVFYFQTGQITKAKEVLDRFKNSSANSSLDVNRIQQFLAQAPATSPSGDQPMTVASKLQLLQLALSLADRTL